MQLSGVGATTATCLAMIGKGMTSTVGAVRGADWVPGQYSSGGKARLGRITKAGDA
ncbi:MAG: transposase [Roseateles sp.]